MLAAAGPLVPPRRSIGSSDMDSSKMAFPEKLPRVPGAARSAATRRFSASSDHDKGRSPGLVWTWRSRSASGGRKYAKTIDHAAMMLLAMSVKPRLRAALTEDVVTAVELRGGRLDKTSLVKFDVHAVFDDIAERAAAILSAALRRRLPGIVDEVDQAFGEQLRALIAATAKVSAV